MKLLKAFTTPEHNALLTALYNAAEAKDDGDAGNATVYDYLENTPKASLVVELVAELKRLGFSIVENT